jgi:hypothetical protein
MPALTESIDRPVDGYSGGWSAGHGYRDAILEGLGSDRVVGPVGRALQAAHRVVLAVSFVRVASALVIPRSTLGSGSSHPSETAKEISGAG